MKSKFIYDILSSDYPTTVKYLGLFNSQRTLIVYIQIFAIDKKNEVCSGPESHIGSIDANGVAETAVSTLLFTQQCATHSNAVWHSADIEPTLNPGFYH